MFLKLPQAKNFKTQIIKKQDQRYSDPKARNGKKIIGQKKVCDNTNHRKKKL